MESTRNKKPESEARRDGQRSGERLVPKTRVRSRIFPYLLVLPALLFELLVHIFPMLVGVGVSFLELTQFYVRNWSAAPFVGFRNYVDGLDPSGPIGGALAQSFLITFAYTVLVVGGSWVLGISAAMLVNSEFRGRRWFRALFLIPYALPVYVAVIAWSFMLQQDKGAVN
nr:sugar ABC transporter permease [Rubrobacter sp.]